MCVSRKKTVRKTSNKKKLALDSLDDLRILTQVGVKCKHTLGNIAAANAYFHLSQLKVRLFVDHQIILSPNIKVRLSNFMLTELLRPIMWDKKTC